MVDFKKLSARNRAKRAKLERTPAEQIALYEKKIEVNRDIINRALHQDSLQLDEKADLIKICSLANLELIEKIKNLK